MFLLQATQAAAQAAHAEESMNLFALVAKGGWIMIPLFILLGVAVFMMSDTWMITKKLGRVNPKWFAYIIKLVYSRDIDQALVSSKKSDAALARMAATGLRSYDLPMKTIEEDMAVEARQILAKTEGHIGYLSMIAAIAPMLGFLGTIFGVIKIFFSISLSNDISISSISDGLYQKMICSATGLLIGIIAYLGYYILNRRVEEILLTMDKGGNELLKALTVAKGISEQEGVN